MLQEYFIRHTDGYALNTESEKERIRKCLEAAIERRVCEVRRTLFFLNTQFNSKLDDDSL